MVIFYKCHLSTIWQLYLLCHAYATVICVCYSYRMEQTLEYPKQKPGPINKGYKQTVIQLPPDLLDWAKHQPEGIAGLARLLMAQERQRRTQSA